MEPVAVLEAGKRKKCPSPKIRSRKSGNCKYRKCPAGKYRSPKTRRCRSRKMIAGGETVAPVPEVQVSGGNVEAPIVGGEVPVEAPIAAGEVVQVAGGSVAAIAGGSVAPAEPVIAAGARTKRRGCGPNKVRDRKSKQCRAKKCGRGKTRDRSTGRCRSTHRGSKTGSPTLYKTPGRRRMAGGDVLLTAGALEEAFQAGLAAGSHF
jgi:hypothetical protein